MIHTQSPLFCAVFEKRGFSIFHLYCDPVMKSFSWSMPFKLFFLGFLLTFVGIVLVVIAGFGRVGKNIAQGLRDVGITYSVIEIDPEIGDAHYGLAFGFYQLKKYDLAWKHIKMAQELGVEVTQEQLSAIKSRLR